VLATREDMVQSRLGDTGKADVAYAVASSLTMM
jgi:hypothetical protein